MRSRLMRAFGTTVPEFLYPSNAKENDLPQGKTQGVCKESIGESKEVNAREDKVHNNPATSLDALFCHDDECQANEEKVCKPSKAKDGLQQACYICKNKRDVFAKWRNNFTVLDAQQRCKRVRPGYSCGILSSGGLLCTMAAIRSGFTPRWGTEIDETVQRMWTDLTGTKSLGDTFKTDFRKLKRLYT